MSGCVVYRPINIAAAERKIVTTKRIQRVRDVRGGAASRHRIVLGRAEGTENKLKLSFLQQPARVLDLAARQSRTRGDQTPQRRRRPVVAALRRRRRIRCGYDRRPRLPQTRQHGLRVVRLPQRRRCGRLDRGPGRVALRRGGRFTAFRRRGGLPFRDNNNCRDRSRSRRRGRDQRCRLPLRCVLPGLVLRPFPLSLRRRQRVPGLLGFVPPGGDFVSKLQHLLPELFQARGHRRSLLSLILLGRGDIGETVPPLPRQAQIGIRLAENRHAKQEQPGGRGRC